MAGSTAAGRTKDDPIGRTESPQPGARNTSPCLRRGVDGPRRVAGDGRAHLHGGLIPEAPVEAQRIRRNELHEALLSHAVIVVVGHYDVPELLLGRGLNGISALSLERGAPSQLAGSEPVWGKECSGGLGDSLGNWHMVRCSHIPNLCNCVYRSTCTGTCRIRRFHS